MYFRDALDSEWKFKMKNVLCWGRGCAFVSTGNKKLWIPSKLIEIRFSGEDPPRKILATDIKKNKPRKSKRGDTYFTSSNIKQKNIFGWLVYNSQFILVYVIFESLCAEQGDQTPMKRGDTGDLASVVVSLEFTFKADG